MPTVRVRYFAVLREKRGTSDELLTFPGGTTIGDAYASLFPGLDPVAFVRNRATVPASTTLDDGDEIGFLPPLGGG